MEVWQIALLFYCTVISTIIVILWIIRRSV